MTNTPDSDFDRWIHGLVSDAVSDAPAAPPAPSLGATTALAPTEGPRRWHTPALAGAVAAAAIVAIVTIPRVGDDTLDDVGPMATTPPASAPDDNPFSVPQATMDTTAPVPTSERLEPARRLRRRSSLHDRARIVRGRPVPVCAAGYRQGRGQQGRGWRFRRRIRGRRASGRCGGSRAGSRGRHPTAPPACGW